MILFPLKSVAEVCLLAAEAGQGPLYFYSYVILNNQKHDFSVCKFM